MTGRAHLRTLEDVAGACCLDTGSKTLEAHRVAVKASTAIRRYAWKGGHGRDKKTR